jgi:asparagine synthase (glutamine-hydrolysing)
MCGILFAEVNRDGARIQRERFEQALCRMAKRGPDYGGTSYGEGFAIGARRLTIIDLSADANQPMWDAAGRYVISFNGEIYNYQELRDGLIADGFVPRTHSDTEVLLELLIRHGPDTALARVRGMFAFVLHDTRERKTWAARDHFGQKPLYYSSDGNQLVIASDIRSILDLSETAEPHLDAYTTYLASAGIIHPESTFFRGIRAVPAGHILQSIRAGLTMREYSSTVDLWEDAEANRLAARSPDENEEELLGHLRLAVKRHMVSDVPVATLLSGGIDSSIIFWLAHDQDPSHTAITKVSPGIEEIPMKVVPQLLAARPANFHMSLESPENYVSGLVDFVEASHAPSHWGGGPPMHRLCDLAQRLGIYVLMGGDCADEYFAGYLSYATRFGAFTGDLSELGELTGIRHDSPFYEAARCEEFETYNHMLRARILERLKAVKQPFERFVQASLLHDTAVFLQTCNLPHSDAYSMMASVELRNPMLDLDVVRFVVNLPTSQKFAEGTPGHPGKHLLRRLARRLIGDYIDMAKEGTRNYSMRIADSRYWNLDRFAIRELVSFPQDVTPRDLIKLVNLELFHRLYFLGQQDPASEVLTPDGRQTLMNVAHE